MKRPTKSKEQPETIYNELKTTYNDLNLPTMRTKKTQNDQQWADFEIISQYGAIGCFL